MLTEWQQEMVERAVVALERIAVSLDAGAASRRLAILREVEAKIESSVDFSPDRACALFLVRTMIDEVPR